MMNLKIQFPRKHKETEKSSNKLIKWLKIARHAIIPLIVWVTWIGSPTLSLGFFPNLIISAGLGWIMVQAFFWSWKGKLAIKHDVWCKGQKECGE